MKLRSFSSTLNFAIANMNEDRVDDNKGFENNFDEIIKKAIQYIRKVVDGSSDKGTDLTTEELITLILNDYNKLVDETYKNADIPIISMKYIAVRYLSNHRDEIPGLLQEIEKRGMEYSEDESYTDDFHENLLLATMAIKEDYKQYYENMKATNGEFLVEIEEFVEKYGKIDGFKKYCDKYSNQKRIPFTARRQIIAYAYFTIFGIEGMNENDIPPKSSAVKYKNSNALKDYVVSYLERLEPLYRENLETSIISRVSQLDNLGEIAGNVELHNEKMRRIGLPGLGYFVENNNKGNYEGAPKVEDLMSRSTLSSLDIDVLLRMNSFYNNRFAKVINDYAMALFVLDNTNSIKSSLEGNILTKSDLSYEKLKQLMIKYQTLILPIKAFYAETQKQIEENPDGFEQNVQEIGLGEGTAGNKKQVVLEVDGFAQDLSRAWNGEYEAYFNQVLPGVNNNLRQDVLLANTLYNPIFLSYRFKNMSLKSEYAHLHYLSQEEPQKSLNFGVVISENNGQNLGRKTILLASDGGLNLPNRLHTIRRDFSEFLTAYTGRPLARIYEGFNDFSVGREYISSQVLLPNSKQHIKYIKDLKKGKLAEKGDRVSRMHAVNERFIDHITYCMDSSQFMKSYKVPGTKVDKKGNVTPILIQPIRYIDLTDGRVYTQKQNGELVDKNGVCYGENPKEVRGIDE